MRLDLRCRCAWESAEEWEIIRPTTKWQEMKTGLKKEEFAVATDLYYVSVSKE